MPRSERLARVLEGEEIPVDPGEGGSRSSWDPVSSEGTDDPEKSEPIERFEWSRDRSGSDAAKRPWERN